MSDIDDLVVREYDEVVALQCNNGGCRRPVYRGKECFVCWAGTKWDSMKQRTDHKHGRNKAYIGIRLLISRREFVAWAKTNPPPATMLQPSIDRIKSTGDYTLENIRWLEHILNCRHTQRDTPPGMWLCPGCNRLLPLNPETFHRSQSDNGYQTYCKSCRRTQNH